MSVTVTQVKAMLHIASPYDASFVGGVKALGGRWDAAGRTWAVPLRERAALRALLLKVYRVDGGLPAEAVRPAAVARVPSAEEIDRILDPLRDAPGITGLTPAELHEMEIEEERLLPELDRLRPGTVRPGDLARLSWDVDAPARGVWPDPGPWERASARYHGRDDDDDLEVNGRAIDHREWSEHLYALVRALRAGARDVDLGADGVWQVDLLLVELGFGPPV